MATVLVGVVPAQEKFVIHQELLCSKSQYFAKALTGSFEESKTGVITLDDLSPLLFRIMITWLYSGKIVYTAVDDIPNIERDFIKLKYIGKGSSKILRADDTSTWPKQVLVELYVLADRLDIKELRNNTMDALTIATEQTNRGLNSYGFKFVDSNTTAESPLRRFAVDWLAHVPRHNMVDEEFWLDLPQSMAITALLQRCQRVPPTLCNPCYQKGLAHNGIKLAADHPCRDEDKRPLVAYMCAYHEHKDDEEKKTCQDSRNKTVNK